MRILNTCTLVAFTGALALSPLHADQWDKKTIITINAPMQIPNATLQPGTYTLKLLESASNRHIVTVWDQDGMHLVTTVLAIPNYRLEPKGKSTFSFWETPAGEPQALRAWFYPGDNFGQEFAYPKAQAQQIAKMTGVEVPSMSSDDESKIAASSKQAEEMPTPSAAATEPTPTPTPAPEPAPVATKAADPEPTPAAAAPAPEPQPQPAPRTEPTPAPTQDPAPQDQSASNSMPQTASNWNEVMLVGLLTLVAGMTTFVGRKRA